MVLKGRQLQSAWSSHAMKGILLVCWRALVWPGQPLVGVMGAARVLTDPD